MYLGTVVVHVFDKVFVLEDANFEKGRAMVRLQGAEEVLDKEALRKMLWEKAKGVTLKSKEPHAGKVEELP